MSTTPTPSIGSRDYAPTTPRRVAFIGLGVMGYPMAGHLARAGHTVAVYNRTSAKAAQWVAEFSPVNPAVRQAATPAQAAEGAEFVFGCVGNDEDLRAVTRGAQGAFAGMAPGAIYVDHTTASAEVARELHAHAAERNLHFLDAPISGGQAGAQNGQLTVMCGGEQAVFDAVLPVAQAFSRAITLMGPAGAGQLTKMVNQIAIAGLVQGLAEAVGFAMQAGLDVPTVISAISKGAAQSWQMENRALTMAQGQFDFGFAVDWMRKDLGLVLDEARRNGAHLPVTALVDQFYGDVQALGGNRWDTSSLIARLHKF